MSKPTNVISWLNQRPDDIVYVFERDDLRTITSVTVPEHAVAMFIRDGKLDGILEPGRHVLTSSNIPWLTGLYNRILGYRETPFKLQVIYISLKMFKGFWGIRGMIKAAEDYDVPITLMSNGDYQFRIDDPTIFYTQILGGMRKFDTSDINDLMKGFLNEGITQQLTKQYYMDIYSNLDTASSAARAGLAPFFKQRGIELLALKIAEVRTTDEDQEKIFEYLQFASDRGEALKRFAVMDRMADAIGNSDGGAAIGAGMMLLPQMFQQMQQPIAGNEMRIMCHSCGMSNPYPYNFCSSCGVQAPQQQPPQQQPASPAATPADGQGSLSNSFKNCPYCGEDLTGLRKLPKFCPYCSEELN